MKYATLILLLAGLVACNDAEVRSTDDTSPIPSSSSSSSEPAAEEPPVVVPPVVVPPVVMPVDEELAIIDGLIADENDYRDIVGQSLLTKGLTCTLYTVPNGTATIAGASLTSKATFTWKGVFDQPDAPASDGLNILPAALKPLYTSWFIVKCSGQLVVPETAYKDYVLSSDDGSILTLDGTKLIDLDGQHGTQTLAGSKLLRKGLHSFQIQYFQGPAGGQALRLYSDGKAVPAKYFFH